MKLSSEQKEDILQLYKELFSWLFVFSCISGLIQLLFRIEIFYPITILCLGTGVIAALVAPILKYGIFGGN